MSKIRGIEFRRSSYRGHTIIGRRVQSLLAYGPEAFEEWEIVVDEPTGTKKRVGFESSESWAKAVIDYILDGKAKLK
jgi:hypothetical protein